MNKVQFVASSSGVDQRGPLSVRRIRSLVLALSIAALLGLGLNFAQGPQSASALNFTARTQSGPASVSNGTFGHGGGGGAGITDGTLPPAV